ncbi:hypothetical protein [Vibrio navarrensis]|uniref:hypothetical protein n=1 Tax=Vibrio navarrensis TaxID=29495 RepID=UPI00186A3C60|nr:hypothetical protein [Vibrio navarrensis]MBE4579627.1 hypothetical protein [Vibrio navarrensis]
MDYSEFKEHFSILSDTRQARKSTYNFFEVMFQVVTAMLCGMKTSGFAHVIDAPFYRILG